MKKLSAILLFGSVLIGHAQTPWLISDSGQARIRSGLSGLTNAGRVLNILALLPESGDRAKDLSWGLESMIGGTGHNWIEPIFSPDPTRTRLEFGLSSTNDTTVSNICRQIAIELGEANPKYNSGYPTNRLIISIGQILRATASTTNATDGVRTWAGNTGTLLVAANSTTFWGLNGNSITNAQTSDATAGTRTVLTRPTTLSRLYAVLSAAPGASRDCTITVMTNGVASNLAVLVSASETANNNVASTVTVPAGAEVGIRIVTVASSASTRISWALEGK